MSSHGYQLFTFSMHRPRQPDQPLVLGELNGATGSEAGRAAGAKNDALAVLAGVLRGAENQEIEKRQKHLTITEVTGADGASGSLRRSEPVVRPP